MFVFQKIRLALFSWCLRFEIRSFTLLPTICGHYSYSILPEKHQKTDFYLNELALNLKPLTLVSFTSDNITTAAKFNK